MMLAIMVILLVVVVGMLVYTVIRLMNRNEELARALSSPKLRDDDIEDTLDAIMIALNDPATRENVKAVMYNNAYSEKVL